MGIGKKAGVVSLATFFSRIGGLIRDQLFAALIGAGYYADAFVIAFRIPNLLRDLFAEGALSNAFVPTFTDYEMRKSRFEAMHLANLVLGSLTIVISTVVCLGIIFAPMVVSLIAPGFESIAGKQDLTVLLTRIMFPFLLLVSFAALFMGILNVRNEFAIPAFAPVMFNLVAITFGLGLWLSHTSHRAAVIGWSIATLCGGLAQAAVQVPKLVAQGWKPKLAFRGWKTHPGLRQIALLMVPAILANSGTQINVLVNSILASLLEQGSPSWLNYAFRLMQLPIGVFGVAVSVVTLSVVSKDVAKNNMDHLRLNLLSSLNLVFLLTIPCAVGLWILAVPIVHLIYERGAFSFLDSLPTPAAIGCYAIGLPAYAAVKVKTPVFFALKDSKIPMMASLVGVGINIAFNVLFYQKLRHPGLALGTSLGMITNLMILFFWFERRHGGLPLATLFKRIGQILLATFFMALVAKTCHESLTGKLIGLWGSLLDTIVPISLATAVYFLILLALRVPEAKLILESVKRFIQKSS